jgi:tetratricopeptide (TPR) repeat protein|tara:strand:- start:8927 stop:9619 length:693 start_codon:yes stop_codon:yes gene_type:complete
MSSAMAHMQPAVYPINTPVAQNSDLAPETRLRLQQLTDSLPDVPARLRVLGHGLLDLGLTDLALNCFGRALLADDLDDATHLGLVRTYLQKGSRDQAMSHLEIAISLRPEMRDLRVILADLLCDRHHLRRALDQLAHVLADEPAHAGARRGLANILQNVVLAVRNGDADQSGVSHDPSFSGINAAGAGRRKGKAAAGMMVWNSDAAPVPDKAQTAAQIWYWCEPSHPAIS